MSHMRLDGLLREEEALTDLAIHEAFRDQLKDFDLTVGRLLLQLPHGCGELDDLGSLAGALAPSSDLVEGSRMLEVSVQDVFALSSVHLETWNRRWRDASIP